MREGRTSPASASLPDNDDILGEIMLRLSPLPSSLPRASLVCKRWRCLVSDPQFHRRFCAHHRTPPLLGFFYDSFLGPAFEPLLDRPDRIIPRGCLSLPEHTNMHRRFLGCRHGLAAFLDVSWKEAVVCEPISGSQCHIAFPPEVQFGRNHNIFNGAVLSANMDYGNGYVCSNLHLSPFKFVLLFNDVEKNLACVCVYESESRKWGNISSVAVPAWSDFLHPGALFGNALYWFLGWSGEVDILEFDLGTHSLARIQKPEDAHFTEESSFRLLQTEDGKLCLALGSLSSIQLWERNVIANGVSKWLPWKTIELDNLLSLRHTCCDLSLTLRPPQKKYQTISGFDEDSRMIFLSTESGVFTIHLESLQFKKVSELELEDTWFMNGCYPYRGFYTAVGAGDVGAEIPDTS